MLPWWRGLYAATAMMKETLKVIGLSKKDDGFRAAEVPPKQVRYGLLHFKFEPRLSPACELLSMNSHGRVLDEDCLRQTSRSIREHVPTALATAESPPEHQIKLFESLLKDVFYTSSCTTLSSSHRVAAWNTLCSLVDRSLESELPAVKNSCWSLGIWNRSLGLYLNHAHNARPKSSRQLLTTLTNALKSGLARGNMDVVVLSGYAIRDLLRSLQDYDDPARAKASAQLLGNLLLKEVIPISSVLGYVPSRSNTERENVQALLRTILGWLGRGEFGSTIATTVSAVLDKLEDENSAEPKNSASQYSGLIWLEPLQDVCRQGTIHSDDLRAHLFPVLFKRRFEDFVAFLKYQGLTGFPPLTDGFDLGVHSEAKPSDGLLYTALQTGKDLGLLLETDNDQIACTPSMVFLPITYVEGLLFQSLRSARLAGLSLLTTSPSATRALSRRALQLLRRALAVFFADVDADFRSEVFGALQRLVDRMRSITKVFSQQSSRTESAEAAQVLKTHQEFLKWLHRFLVQELRPSASYQRHISALKGLSIMARSGLDSAVPADSWTKSARGETRWTFHIKVLTGDLQRQLLDLLFDPFDDVRQTAASILRLYPSVSANDNSPGVHELACERAETKMFLSGRADQADGVAHLYALIHQGRVGGQSPSVDEQDQLSKLVDKMEKLLAVAEHDLATAVERYPLHGLLTSLRYVVGNAPTLDNGKARTLFDDLVRVWKLVKPILCDDAPEGYLPEELEETPNSTKETLSYCWRALKESSLLLSSLVAGEEIETDLLKSMSELCFTQLSQLRHRGAFSTVAQTWTACCTRCRDLCQSDDTPLLHSWYGRIIDMLHKNVAINTRRSAGLPSLLCGTLIADHSEQLIASAFVDLEAVARQEVDSTSVEEGSLPQVHAMNCMKDILKNSNLGESSGRHVHVALQLAADALRSDTWAIRNCGLMLFRAVIDRLLGMSAAYLEGNSQMRKQISIEQHPDVLDVILSLLDLPREEAASRYEGVFPALEMLQLARIAKERLGVVKTAVKALTAVSSWHVRDKAARTLSSMEPVSAVAQYLGDAATSHMLGENAVHGALLITGYTLQRAKLEHTQDQKSAMNPASVPTPQDIDTIGSAAAEIFQKSSSFISRAAALDVLRECCDTISRLFEKYDHRGLLVRLCTPQKASEGSLVMVFETTLKTCCSAPGAASIRQAWARLFAQYLLIEQSISKDDIFAYKQLAQELSWHDENACSHLLKAFQGRLDASEPIADLVVDACHDIVNSALRSKSNVDLAIALRSQDALGEKACNQKYVDQWLQLFAIHLDHRSNHDINDSQQIDEHLVQDIALWAEDCASAVNGTGVHSREAAAESIDCIRSLWSILSNIGDAKLDEAFLKLCIAAYDLLNDDDEDIRLQGAQIATRILSANSQDSAQTTSFEPMVASQKLLGFCLRRWKSSSKFASVALHRAFGTGTAGPTPVAEQLEAANSADTVLFAEEKQNLYVDEAKEAKTWSQAMQRVDPSTIPKVSIRQLGEWVAAGLDAFTEQATGQPDGALGWSTSNTVFTLGLRVFYGAEVLFGLATRGVRIPLPPSELRKKLFVCLTAFEDGGADGFGRVNCLWRWEVDRVVKESVSSKLISLGNAVEATFDKARGIERIMATQYRAYNDDIDVPLTPYQARHIASPATSSRRSSQQSSHHSQDFKDHRRDLHLFDHTPPTNATSSPSSNGSNGSNTRLYSDLHHPRRHQIYREIRGRSRSPTRDLFDEREIHQEQGRRHEHNSSAKYRERDRGRSPSRDLFQDHHRARSFSRNRRRSSSATRRYEVFYDRGRRSPYKESPGDQELNLHSSPSLLPLCRIDSSDGIAIKGVAQQHSYESGIYHVKFDDDCAYQLQLLLEMERDSEDYPRQWLHVATDLQGELEDDLMLEIMYGDPNEGRPKEVDWLALLKVTMTTLA
ncbi:hypothetical protein AC578_9051 [Pseudocercospora eumusae]|uniref:Uncharacterized protein n=1 Tax=Pseudocercospora eumusae TaxID=321146 RepID=A0A139H8K8_9PEZI|nr:hypothetical protein AC578_9051 [Pseudocercospora eumusae]